MSKLNSTIEILNLIKRLYCVFCLNQHRKLQRNLESNMYSPTSMKVLVVESPLSQYQQAPQGQECTNYTKDILSLHYIEVIIITLLSNESFSILLRLSYFRYESGERLTKH